MKLNANGRSMPSNYKSEDRELHNNQGMEKEEVQKEDEEEQEAEKRGGRG